MLELGGMYALGGGALEGLLPTQQRSRLLMKVGIFKVGSRFTSCVEKSYSIK